MNETPYRLIGLHIWHYDTFFYYAFIILSNFCSLGFYCLPLLASRLIIYPHQFFFILDFLYSLNLPFALRSKPHNNSHSRARARQEISHIYFNEPRLNASTFATKSACRNASILFFLYLYVLLR